MLCQYSNLDLFSLPPTDGSVDEVIEQEILPLTALTDTGTTVEFSISGDGQQYIDLSETRLHLRVKVSNVDGKSAMEDKKVSLIPYFPQALFRSVDLILNGTLVTTSTNMYPYTAYASSRLSYPKSVQQDQMSVLEHSMGWEVGKDRYETEALMRLHIPLFNQPRLLPNKVDIRLRLLRSPDAFVLQKLDAADTNKYKITIQACSLFVRRITPSATVLLDHAEKSNRMNYLYPIERLWSKFFTLQKGSREFDLANISQGQLPKRILVGLVNSEAFSGTDKSNPFKFEPHNLDYISLQCNGRSYPAVPITTDFGKGVYRRAYQSMLDALLGPCSDNDSINISKQDYSTNTCFFGFTLGKALPGPNQALIPRENGYLNAKLRFNTALTTNLNAIFFMEFENMISIDSSRAIYQDYAS